MEGRIGEEGENEGGKEGGRVWERRVLDPREGWKRRQLKAKGGCDATTNEILRKKKGRKEERREGQEKRVRGGWEEAEGRFRREARIQDTAEMNYFRCLPNIQLTTVGRR